MTTTTDPSVTLNAQAVANPAMPMASDYYRVLFRQLWPNPKQVLRPATLGVTSCANTEGVSTVTVQLANVAAEFDHQVLIFDASGTQGSVHMLGGMRGKPGLFDHLNGEPLEECTQPTKLNNVQVLGTGTSANRSRTTFDAAKIGQVIREIQSSNRLVLVDLPNTKELGTCFSIAAMLEGVVLVVEAERVRNQVVQRTKEQLLQANAALLGVVFNKRRNHVPDWLYKRL